LQAEVLQEAIKHLLHLEAQAAEVLEDIEVAVTYKLILLLEQQILVAVVEALLPQVNSKLLVLQEQLVDREE
jgi:hypothetical protein